MDHNPPPSAPSAIPERYPVSTFYNQPLEEDPAASRLLENHDSSQYTSRTLRVSDTEPDSLQERFPPSERKSPHVYENVATTEGSATMSGSRVYWTGLSVYALTWESLGIVVSILFLVLGAFVANLKGNTESTWSKQIIQATRVAPSVWPILFSGILGNALRQFAYWKVERGIRLLALEQLMGSLTMANSIVAIFTWRIFSYSSLVLVVLWAFNPLGSQASFRGIYLTGALGNGTGTITHYHPNLTVQVALSGLGGGSRRTKPLLRSLYSAALYDVTSSIQYVDTGNATFQDRVAGLGGASAAGVQTAMDLWGNVRIPNIDYLSQYDSNQPHEWVSVPWREQPQNYSSLVGDRFDGLDRGFTGNTTFEMTSSYQHLNCSPWLILENEQIETWTMDHFGQNFTEFRESDLTMSGPGPQEGASYRPFLGVSSSALGKSNFAPPGPPKFIFASLASANNDEILQVTSCDTRTTYVDVQVSCMSRGAGGKASCGVDAIRKSNGILGSDGPSFLEILRVDDRNFTEGLDEFVARNFLAAFTDLVDDNQIGSGQLSIIQRFLEDPLSAFDGLIVQGMADLAVVDIGLVEQRLSLIYNTLWKTSWSYRSMTGGSMKMPTTNVNPALNDTTENTTSYTIQPLQPIYALDLPWMIIYFVSVGIMLLASIASMVLHANCKAPPLLGYVSSLTRDSIFFGEPSMQGNSTESGSKRAGRLGKTEVKIADVWDKEDVGRIAFTPAQGTGVVKRKRWYD